VAACASLVAGVERQSRLMHARLMGLQRVCRSRAADLMTELGAKRQLAWVRLVRAERRCTAACGSLVTGVQRQLRLMQGRRRAVERVCLAMVGGFAVGLRRKRELALARLVGLKPACTSVIMLLKRCSRRQRRVFSARIGRVERACRSIVAAQLVELGAKRRLGRERLARVRRNWMAGILGLAAGFQRQLRRLYVQAIRHGSRGRQRPATLDPEAEGTALRNGERLGTPVADQASYDPPGRTPLRVRLAWSFAGLLVGGALTAAAATAFMTMHGFGSAGKTSAGASNEPHAIHRIVIDVSPQRATSNSSPRVWHDRPPRPSRSRPSPRSAPSVPRTPSQQITPSQQMSFVSNAVQTVSVHPARVARPAVTTGATATGGARPLPAPTGASAPSPMPAPSR
jgi:hypothetical protein